MDCCRRKTVARGGASARRPLGSTRDRSASSADGRQCSPRFTPFFSPNFDSGVEEASRENHGLLVPTIVYLLSDRLSAHNTSDLLPLLGACVDVRCPTVTHSLPDRPRCPTASRHTTRVTIMDSHDSVSCEHCLSELILPGTRTIAERASQARA
jgi:hypothetical protein